MDLSQLIHAAPSGFMPCHYPHLCSEIGPFHFTAANGEDSTRAMPRKTEKDLAEENCTLQPGTGFTT